MPLIPTLTQLDKGIQAGAEAAHHFASILNAHYQSVWNRDPETVAAELNADVHKSATIMQLNSQAAIAVNALLDALDDPRFQTRASDSLPANWSVGEAGFVYTAPEPPVDTPENA